MIVDDDGTRVRPLRRRGRAQPLFILFYHTTDRARHGFVVLLIHMVYSSRPQRFSFNVWSGHCYVQVDSLTEKQRTTFQSRYHIRCCCCCLHNKAFFLPKGISRTPSPSWCSFLERDTASVITCCETEKNQDKWPTKIGRQVKYYCTGYASTTISPTKGIGATKHFWTKGIMRWNTCLLYTSPSPRD